MAKKKPESGPGTFMIIALVFFVLASAVLGVTTYLGFSEQGELVKQKEEAEKKEKAAKAQADEQIARRNVLRIGVGIDDPQDREDLRGAAKANEAAVLDEYKRVTDKLGGAAMPGGRNQFTWGLAGNEPAPAPNKSILQITGMWASAARDAEQRYKTEQVAHGKTQEAKAAADKRAEDQKASFDQQVADLTKQMKEKTDAMDKAFLALKDAADQKGKDFRKAMDEWAQAKVNLDELVLAGKAQNQVLKDRLHRAENADPSDLMARLNRADPAKIAERMGTVQSKSGQFVNIDFNERRIHLLPQQAFIVIASNTSLTEVLEREKALEKKHTEFTSNDAREAFKDNELVKGMVEITRVTGPNSAEARITFHPQELRNPITRGDQLFNMALSSGAKEHVAFAGIIDLDGDGKPDNENFLAILKRNNLDVDAFLDLKSGVIKGKINPSTQFLI
ncbi:MAG TPA: hypothetical protein VKD90_07280, partial [Gemmataceae bacterium]|nr:hypothetical protein [Gemmataceae bacterium]